MSLDLIRVVRVQSRPTYTCPNKRRTDVYIWGRREMKGSVKVSIPEIRDRRLSWNRLDPYNWLDIQDPKKSWWSRNETKKRDGDKRREQRTGVREDKVKCNTLNHTTTTRNKGPGVLSRGRGTS